MTGNNELRFNQATMREAVQLYLESIFKEGKAPKVVSVVESNNADIFVIEIEERENGPAPD